MENKVRRMSTCSPNHECTPEEIQELTQEIEEIYNDPTISRYRKPSLDDMKHVITIAENYTGEWYHSEIVLSTEIESNEKEQLKKNITELGSERGIAIAYESPEIDEILKNLFNK